MTIYTIEIILLKVKVCTRRVQKAKAKAKAIQIERRKYHKESKDMM